MSKAHTLEVFTDYVCPWCYLGDHRLKKIKHVYIINVKLRHFPLHPETPTEGRELKDLFNCEAAEIDNKNAHMRTLMEKEGLPFSNRTHTYNSRLAQEIGAWAETQCGGASIHDKFYEAYFVDGLNLADTDVILSVVAKAGLKPEDARIVLEDRQFKTAIDRDWSKSQQYGITGVPTFVIAGRGLVGAQSCENLAHLLDEVGIKKRQVSANLESIRSYRIQVFLTNGSLKTPNTLAVLALFTWLFPYHAGLYDSVFLPVFLADYQQNEQPADIREGTIVIA